MLELLRKHCAGCDGGRIFEVDYFEFLKKWWCAMQKAGLKQEEMASPHLARHTFAVRLLAAGENIKAVSRAMGHASIQITLDRYGRFIPENVRLRVELLDSNSKCQLSVVEATAAATPPGNGEKRKEVNEG